MSRHLVIAWLAALLCCACAPSSSTVSTPASAGARPAELAAPSAAAERAGPTGAAAPGSDAPVPVTSADPSSGSPTAPVTIVVFSDFECPFCKGMSATLKALQRRYGPEQLRVVWKNFPLYFHRQARPSAEAAMAVFAHRGPAAFWAFHDTVFGASGALSPALRDEALRRAGVDAGALQSLLSGGAAARKVDEDMALAGRLGVNGTPASFVNGVLVSGAQPAGEFAAIIDAQLAEARALVASGTPAEQVYAVLARKNYAPPSESQEDEGEAPDTTVHRVPVGDSPVRGKSAALVTVVMFGDYQCPFCARAMPTMDKLAAQYGDKLRFVWKDEPLGMHRRAEPAAELALEARAQKGDAAFWDVHGRLMERQRDLEEPALLALAAELKLDVAAVKRAIASHKHAAKIDADLDLADDLEADGTPHFFINGRRLVGAQPIGEFQALIDEELKKAEALVAKGTPADKVYETLQKDAALPEAPPRVDVASPGKESPSKGPAGAKVVVQMFGDFECPYCARGAATMDELMKAFPGAVRVVWRNLPLPMHEEAALAAEAAMEAYAQQGATGFWKMHELLFKDPTAGNLGRGALERHAATAGLDAKRFATALDGHTRRAAVEADAKAAKAAGINGTPGFVINGYLVSGAQPLTKFKKIVRRALAEAK